MKRRCGAGDRVSYRRKDNAELPIRSPGFPGEEEERLRRVREPGQGHGPAFGDGAHPAEHFACAGQGPEPHPALFPVPVPARPQGQHQRILLLSGHAPAIRHPAFPVPGPPGAHEHGQVRQDMDGHPRQRGERAALFPVHAPVRQGFPGSLRGHGPRWPKAWADSAPVLEQIARYEENRARGVRQAF